MLGFANKFAETNGATLVNFALPDDDALGIWKINNAGPLNIGSIYKPDRHSPAWQYYYNPNGVAGQKLGIEFPLSVGRSVNTFHEAAAYVTASRTKAVGTAPLTAGSISTNIDMDAAYGFRGVHSAEWVEGYLETRAFYVDLMEEFELDPIR